jgi:hypothetical protein
MGSPQRSHHNGKDPAWPAERQEDNKAILVVETPLCFPTLQRSLLSRLRQSILRGRAQRRHRGGRADECVGWGESSNPIDGRLDSTYGVRRLTPSYLRQSLLLGPRIRADSGGRVSERLWPSRTYKWISASPNPASDGNASHRLPQPRPQIALWAKSGERRPQGRCLSAECHGRFANNG